MVLNQANKQFHSAFLSIGKNFEKQSKSNIYRSMELAELTAAAGKGHQQQQQPRVCPRCKSKNTKFCYFNNYSLTQPRYFCKGCRRYWTHGGTLRNVPVGGFSRKVKRPRNIPSASAAVPNSPEQTSVDPNSAPIATTSVVALPNLFLSEGGVGGCNGGFLSSLVVGPSMNLQARVLQVRPDLTPFRRQDLFSGCLQGFNGAGGKGSVRTAVTGAQFWTLGGSVGAANGTAVASAGDQAGCGSNPNDQWRNFPAVAGGGDDDQ